MPRRLLAVDGQSQPAGVLPPAGFLLYGTIAVEPAACPTIVTSWAHAECPRLAPTINTSRAHADAAACGIVTLRATSRHTQKPRHRLVRRTPYVLSYCSEERNDPPGSRWHSICSEERNDPPGEPVAFDLCCESRGAHSLCELQRVCRFYMAVGKFFPRLSGQFCCPCPSVPFS